MLLLCRQSGTYQADPAAAVEDERLLTAVYALMRAGCDDDALELCANSACAWRSAAMSACGWGLLPVGKDTPAAQKLLSDKARKSSIAADVLTLHSDGAAMAPACAAAACIHRQTWRSACSAVASAAAQRATAGTVEGAAAGWEAAVFGILAGTHEHCEGLCKNWRDRMWVQGRALLQSEPDRLLLSKTSVASGAGGTRRTRAWDTALSGALGVPLKLPAVPGACSGSSVSRHVNVRTLLPVHTAFTTSHASTHIHRGFVQEYVRLLSRDATADAPLHDLIQRYLIAASLQPLCTVAETDQQHPLQSLLELLLSLPTMPAPSPAVRENRVRFAAHFGLALVSLNAIPGDPGLHPLYSLRAINTHMCSGLIV